MIPEQVALTCSLLIYSSDICTNKITKCDLDRLTIGSGNPIVIIDSFNVCTD